VDPQQQAEHEEQVIEPVKAASPRLNTLWMRRPSASSTRTMTSIPLPSRPSTRSVSPTRPPAPHAAVQRRLALAPSTLPTGSPSGAQCGGNDGRRSTPVGCSSDAFQRTSSAPPSVSRISNSAGASRWAEAGAAP
jgi:hypothetical protein